MFWRRFGGCNGSRRDVTTVKSGDCGTLGEVLHSSFWAYCNWLPVIKIPLAHRPIPNDLAAQL